MKSWYYKHCIVPHCKNTTIKTPTKLFIYVPNNPEIRRKWLKRAGRDDACSLSADSRMYFCEDHFDLPKDMDNYMEYHIMGKVSQVRMKPGCLPSKFACQEGVTCSHTELMLNKKKQRMRKIAESLVKLQKRSTSSSAITKKRRIKSDTSSKWNVTQEHNYFKEQDEEDVTEPSSVITTGCADSFEHNYFKDDNFKSGMSDPKNGKNILPNLSACEQSAPPSVLVGDESPRAALCDAMLSSADDDVPEPSPPPPPLLDLHTAQMCRVCLALDVKMFDLRDSELKIMFHSITGIELEDNEGSTLGSLICWECAARLRAASTFRSKALLSDTLLQRLISKGEQIENEYFETVKEEADRLVPPKTLTVTEIIRLVDIEEQNNKSQLIQLGDDQHSISDRSETQDSVMDEIKDHTIDEICQINVEGDDHVATTNEIENHPTCLITVDENITTVDDENPQFILLDIGETLLGSELTSPQEDYDDQIIKSFLKSITKSNTLPEQNIEPKISNKRRKDAVSNDRASYLKEDSQDGNKKKKLKTYGGTSKKVSRLKAATNTQVF